MGHTGTKKSRSGIQVLFVPAYRYAKYSAGPKLRSEGNLHYDPKFLIVDVLSNACCALGMCGLVGSPHFVENLDEGLETKFSLTLS